MQNNPLFLEMGILGRGGKSFVGLRRATECLIRGYVKRDRSVGPMEEKDWLWERSTGRGAGKKACDF